MSKKALAAIAFLAMAVLTVSYGVLAEETEELQTEKDVTFMFVQTAQSGTLIPVEGEDNLYTLTLMDVSPQTTAFSDRPERVVVQVPMQRFLDGMCFAPDDGPNAALEILEADEEEDLTVVELFDPVYDAANQTLKYNMSILEMPDLSYAIFNERHDETLPEAFGPAALFIDDCKDGQIECHTDDPPYSRKYCGNFGTGCCWSTSHFNCIPCHSYEYYVDTCIQKYGTSCNSYESTCSVWSEE